jgi:malate permease and related proteins
MNQTATVLGAVLPVFGIMVVGLVIRKIGWLTEEADTSLLRVNINLLLPALILDSAFGNPALSQPGTLALAPVIGFSTTALGILLAWGCRGLTGLKAAPAQRTFAVSTGMYNYGFVPVPLTMLMFGSGTVGVLFVHNVGVEIALWTLGVAVMTGAGIGGAWRKIVNAPLVAILLALALNAAGAVPHLPTPLLTGLHWLGQCAIPMSILLSGAIVADHLHEFHSAHGWRVIAAGMVLRLGVLPLCFLLLARWLPCSVELKRVIVVQAAMTSALFPIAMAKHYGGDPATALRVVISTSAAGLVTIPLWMRFGMKFAGL